MLKKQNISLIEYVIFFGSIQIFNYLRHNGVKLKSSMFIYAIHGQSAEIIHFLEENKILPSKDDKISFRKIFIESIKCHHIDVANFRYDNENFRYESGIFLYKSEKSVIQFKINSLIQFQIIFFNKI